MRKLKATERPEEQFLEKRQTRGAILRSPNHKRERRLDLTMIFSWACALVDHHPLSSPSGGGRWKEGQATTGGRREQEHLSIS